MACVVLLLVFFTSCCLIAAVCMTMQGHIFPVLQVLVWNWRQTFFSEIIMATEAVAASSSSSSSSASLGNSSKMDTSSMMLPSFSDILWCPDIDEDVMSNPVMNAAGGETVLSDPLSTESDSLDSSNLTDFMQVSNGSVAHPVKLHVPTSVATSTSNSASDMPSDISDLRSQDLLSTLSGVGVDIDRMFEEVWSWFSLVNETLFFHFFPAFWLKWLVLRTIQ